MFHLVFEGLYSPHDGRSRASCRFLQAAVVSCVYRVRSDGMLCTENASFPGGERIRQHLSVIFTRLSAKQAYTDT
jgi:hypothetical protein